jgi:hypothetical protein
MIDPIEPFEGITECMLHSVYTDLDCEFCQGELEAKAKRQQTLAEDANERMARIQSLGANVAGEAVLNERLNVLIDAVVSDPRQRVHFEAAFNARVINQLIDVEKEVRRQQIITQKPPTIITPKHDHGRRM